MTARTNLWNLAGGAALAALATLTFALGGCGSSGGAKDASGSGGARDGATGGSGGSGGGSGGSGGGSGGSSASDAGTGGSSADASDASVGCPTAQYTHSFNFGAIFEGWAINNSYSSPNLVPMPAADGAPASGTVIDIDHADGFPTPNGSLKLNAPFSGTGELLLLNQLFTQGVNMSGTRVTAQFKLDSGLIRGAADTARANLVLKSGAGYFYADGPAVVLDPTAGWITLNVDGDNPNIDAVTNGYNPCDVREIDVEIRTGDTGNYQAAVIHIDTIAVTSKTAPPPDAGSTTDATTSTDATTTADATTSTDATASTDASAD